MKKIVYGCIIVLFVCFSSSANAQDGFFSDAQADNPNQFSFGIQPVIYTQLSDDEFMALFRAMYEFPSGMAFHGKIGLLKEETYFGGHIVYPIAAEPYNPLSVAVVGGIYHFEEFGLKLGGILSKEVGDFSLYTGLTFEPLFTNPELLPLLIPIGINIPLSGEQADFTFEVDLGLNEDAEAYEALHFGVKVYFQSLR